MCLGAELDLNNCLDYFFLKQKSTWEAIHGCGDQALFFPPCSTTGLASTPLCSLGTWDKMNVTLFGFKGLLDRLIRHTPHTVTLVTLLVFEACLKFGTL